MTLNVCSDHLMDKRGMHTILTMLLMRLDWKVQINSQIPVLCTGSNILRRDYLAVEKRGALQSNLVRFCS